MMLCRRVESLPIEVHRARLPRRLGLEGLPAGPAPSAGSRCRPGLRESDRLPEPIFTPSTKAERGPRREHLTSTRRPSSSARERAPSGSRDLALALYRSRRRDRRAGRDHPRRHEVRVRARSGERRAAPDRRGPDARLVALLGRRGLRAGPGPGELRQAVRPRLARDASRGTRPPPGPELPADVVAGTRARYVEAFERITGAQLRALSRRRTSIAPMSADFRFAVNVTPEARHPRPAGPGGRGQPRPPRDRRGAARSASGGGSS